MSKNDLHEKLLEALEIELQKMKENFEQSLKMLVKHEGNYSFHPDDPGGETMKGVTRVGYE